MQIPDPLQLRRDDFPKDSWVDRFLRPMNLFTTQVRSALSKLTFAENHNAQFKTLNLTAASAPPFTVQHELDGPCTMLIVANVLNKTTNLNTSVGPVSAVWKNTGRSILISTLTGLSVGPNYQVTFLLLGENI